MVSPYLLQDIEFWHASNYLVHAIARPFLSVCLSFRHVPVLCPDE